MFWQTRFAPGLEHLVLDARVDRIVGEGVMTVHEDPGGPDPPFRVRYRIECDGGWRVRELSARATAGATVALRSDGEGHWTDGGGARRPELDGAIDVDIAACGFTNAITIRRLALAAGASREEPIAYVHVPSLAVERVVQRYTCLDRSLTGSRWRYENLTHPYDTAIDVDADGLTLHYPDVLDRLWPDGVDVPLPLVTSGIVERDGRILLLRRSAAKDHGPGEWEPVSGRVEPGESPRAAAIREVKEETGLDVDVLAPLDTFRFLRGDARVERLGIAFHCRVTGGTLALSAEHDEARFIPRSELLTADLSEAVRRGLTRFIALGE